ncbi:MAG: glutamyl-tRNA reductase [Firmicutes bacterium]|nr:glutamyl-tRNA reductase [Bacillota bacterium]
MKLGLISFSFKNTPLEIREKIKFTTKNYHHAYRLLKNSSFLDGAVILSTCNRTEIYFVNNDETCTIDRNGSRETKNSTIYSDCKEYILDILEETFNPTDITKRKLKKYLEYKEGSKVTEHLFELASGLRSQVIGEEQILSQVKEVLQNALEHQASDRNLNRLFQKAISTAKKVRDETGIAKKNLSISSICVNYIEQLFNRLEDKSILVIGVGKISRIVLELLQECGIEDIYATNRTHGKMVKIADYFDNLKIVEYNQLHQVAVNMDIIISSTAAPHYVLKSDYFKKYYRNWHIKNNVNDDKDYVIDNAIPHSNKKNIISHKDKKDTISNLNNNDAISHTDNNFNTVGDTSSVELCIFDLAVPRDVDPEIGRMAGIRLYNIDDLDRELDRNQKYRQEAADKARGLIGRYIKEMDNWLNWQQVVPVIKEIKRLNQKIIDEEVEKITARLNDNEKLNQEINSFADHLEKKLFNRIINNMKTMIDESDDEQLLDKFL